MSTISQLTHGSFFNSLPLKKRPECYIFSTNTVCVVRKFTSNAPKNQSISVGLINTTTTRTRPTCIFRKNGINGYPDRISLVGDKKLKHKVGPTVVPCPLLMVLFFVFLAVIPFETF
jgi:hypothetical protein